MSYLREAEPPADFGPFKALRQSLGFVPGIFRAQTLLPRLLEAEAAIADAVLMQDGALSRILKESILLVVSASEGNAYCSAAHAEMLRILGISDDEIERLAFDHRHAGLPEADVALLDFCLKLAKFPARIRAEDLGTLRRQGFADEGVLEAILITSLARFLCTLSAGLGVEPDFSPPPLPQAAGGAGRKAGFPGASEPDPAGASGPYLRAADLRSEEFAPFAFFRDRFGFVPNLFRAQTLRPGVVEAEAKAVGAILLTDDVLSRVRKEYILLVNSAASLNTYCVAVHCEMLRGLGIPEAVSDQIALDHHQADLSPADKTLLDFSLRLSARPKEFGSPDLDLLRREGFTEEQILEALVMTSLTHFLNTLQAGLGTVPDFEPRVVFQAPHAKETNLFQGAGRPIHGDPDPDFAAIARFRDGNLDAFEDLVRRHSPRIYRVIMGITGNAHDAEDGVQDTFLKVFEHLRDFRGESSFSTWLTRIAINEGVQRLRGRRNLEPLEESPFDGDAEEEPFRPRQIAAWEEDPEKICAQTEFREILEREIMKLPPRYRMAVLLRDMEQLSAEEAAAVLDLGVPTLKTHLLRGRLMLREALTPLFTRPREASRHV